MTARSVESSPTYRNLKIRQRYSPIEMKEKMRKSYKEKIHNCRNLLIHNFRGVVDENDLRKSLSVIWSEMFDSNTIVPYEEETEVLALMKEEILHAELNWLLEEYEKSQMDNIDWSAAESRDAVICPVCQKENITRYNDGMSCPKCNWQVKTQNSFLQVKSKIMSSIEKHLLNCTLEPQFSSLSDGDDWHVYLICGHCSEMQLII